VLDEACRIISGGPECRWVIQKAEQRVWVPLGSDPGQGAQPDQAVDRGAWRYLYRPGKRAMEVEQFGLWEVHRRAQHRL
jgi:hypothetical protein